MKNFDFYFAGIATGKIFDDTVRVFHHNMLASYLQKKIIDKTAHNMREYKKNPDILNGFVRNAPWMKLGAPGKLFVDSGAFSVWTKGAAINVDEYIEWLNSNADCLTLFGQVDKIPGTFGITPTREQIREAAMETMDNYYYMRARLANPDGLLYTFHYGEPFDILYGMLNKAQNMKYMALGGIVGKSKMERDVFLREAFEVIKRSANPKIKVHAFGMTDFDLIKKYPIYSVDSTSWLMTAINGIIGTKYGSIVVSEKQGDRNEHYSNRFPAARVAEVQADTVGRYGFTFEELSNDLDKRIYYNADFTKDKIEHTERPVQRHSRILFKK